MTVEVRPTTSDDIDAFMDEPLPARARARTILKDGKIVGIVGLLFLPLGIVAAFADLTEEVRSLPLSLHRYTLRALSEARDAGYRQLIATCDAESEVAARWLLRLGFEDTGGIVNERKLFRWSS
jgi:RimJ/RimL family protein N-acetyltransferase